MDQQSEYLQRIQERYPELPVEKVVYLDQDGQSNDVLILNDEVVFRFPRFAQVIEQLSLEKAILSRIQAAMPLPVPRPMYSSLGEQEVGQVFVGYQIIPGQSLTVDILSHLDAIEQRRIAKQLASFLRALHDFPTDFLGMELPLHDTLKYWANMYEDARELVFPHLSPAAQKKIAESFETAFAAPERLVYEPRLRHGDFGPSNILFNEESQQVSGIIDFSCSGLGDPAVDLAAVSLYGEAFVQDMISVYPELEEMKGRARFYRGTFALQEALYGARTGDEEAFRAGVEGIGE